MINKKGCSFEHPFFICYSFFLTGSQVNPIPNFLNIFWSTSLNITVQCT